MNDLKLECVNMNKVVTSEVSFVRNIKEPHFMQPTISSLIKEGHEDEALKGLS